MLAALKAPRMSYLAMLSCQGRAMASTLSPTQEECRPWIVLGVPRWHAGSSRVQLRPPSHKHCTLSFILNAQLPLMLWSCRMPAHAAQGDDAGQASPIRPPPRPWLLRAVRHAQTGKIDGMDAP